MANIWKAHLRIEEGYETEGANHPLKLEELPDDPYIPKQTVNFFARDNASDIPGYKTLENENGFDMVELTAQTNASRSESRTVDIAEFATAEFNDGQLADGTTTFRFSAWFSTSLIFASVMAQAICEIYHMDAAGYETLISSFWQSVNKTEKQYTKQRTINEIFEQDERYVIKWRMKFTPIGIS